MRAFGPSPTSRPHSILRWSDTGASWRAELLRNCAADFEAAEAARSSRAWRNSRASCLQWRPVGPSNDRTSRTPSVASCSQRASTLPLLSPQGADQPSRGCRAGDGEDDPAAACSSWDLLRERNRSHEPPPGSLFQMRFEPGAAWNRRREASRSVVDGNQCSGGGWRLLACC